MKKGGREGTPLSAVRFRLGGEEYVLFELSTAARELLPRLTIAEREVALALVRGGSNAAIARARGRSVRTIANQVASIFRTLGVRSRGELAALFAGVSRPGGS